MITVRTLKLVLLKVKFDLYASIYLSELIYCFIPIQTIDMNIQMGLNAMLMTCVT